MCDCEGPLHYTTCWWVATPGNDDGRFQATGDPEQDAESIDLYNYWLAAQDALNAKRDALNTQRAAAEASLIALIESFQVLEPLRLIISDDAFDEFEELLDAEPAPPSLRLVKLMNTPTVFDQ